MGLVRSLRVLTTAAVLVAIGGAPTAQVPIDRLRDVLGGGGLLRAIGGEAPVTTSIDRATTEAPSLDGFEPVRWLRLQDQPRDGSGAFQVAPGSYEFQRRPAIACTRARTAPAAATGTSTRRSKARQRDIQVLLWAILARTPVDQMPRGAKAAALRLLTPGQVLELGIGAMPLIDTGIWGGEGPSMPPAMARALQAESRLRQLFARADTPYLELERVAVLLGDPEPDPARREVPRGRWSSHADGYYLRFFPSGYDETRVQVYVPEPTTTARGAEVDEAPGFRFASRAESPISTDGSATRPVHVTPVGRVRVDLSEAVAVPAARGRQRLAMSGREH